MSLRIHGSPLALALALVFAAGCGGGGSDGSSESASVPGGAMVSNAKYDLRADTASVDTAAWDAMVVPHDGADVWLKLEAKDSPWLAPGSVVVIKGRGVLKVASVREDGDHLVVEKTPVDYSDFIENGSIDIHGATAFDQKFQEDPSDFGVASNGEAPVENSAPADVAPQSLHTLGLGKSLLDGLKDLVTDGWKVEKHISGDGNALHYDITLSKSRGALVANVHAVGNVNNLQTAFSVAVQNHVTDQQTFDVHTSGDADITWEVGISEGSVGYNKLVLPGISYKQQFFVGEIPMVLKVKSGFAIIIGATGKNTTSTGKVHVSYTSDGGVQVTPGAGDTNATGTGDTSYEDDKGTLAVGPSAFGFVATLPKVELGVGLDSLFTAGAYFSNITNTIVQSRGAVALDTCSTVNTKFTGTVGLYADAGLIGTAVTKGIEKTGNKLSKTLYEVEKNAVTCGLK